MTSSHRTLIPLCLAATWLVWGSTYLGIKYALLSFDPFVLSGVRYLLAGSMMLGYVKARGAPWPGPRQLGNAALVGILMTAVGNGLTCMAEKTIPSGATALVVATTPLLTVVFARLLGTRAHPLEWLGIGLGFAGIVLMNFDASLAVSPRGVAYVLVACASWALASALMPRLDLPAGAMGSALQMLAGGICSVPLALLAGERLPAHVEAKAAAAALYLTVFGSMIAYSAFVWLLRHVRPALATSSSYVNPVVALLLGWLMAGERVGWPLIAGMTVILSGVVLISRASRRA